MKKLHMPRAPVFKYTSSKFVFISAKGDVWSAKDFPAPIRRAAGLVELALEKMRAPDPKAELRARLREADALCLVRSMQQYRPGYWISPDGLPMRVDADFMNDYGAAVACSDALIARLLNGPTK